MLVYLSKYKTLIMTNPNEQQHISPASPEREEPSIDGIGLIGREIDLQVFHGQAVRKVIDLDQQNNEQSAQDRERKAEVNLGFVRGFIELLPKSQSGHSIRVSSGREAMAMTSSVVWLPTKPPEMEKVPEWTKNKPDYYLPYKDPKPYYLIGSTEGRSADGINRRVNSLLLMSAQTHDLIAVSGWVKETDALRELISERLEDENFINGVAQTYSDQEGEYVISDKSTPSIEVKLKAVNFHKIPDGFSIHTKKKIQNHGHIHVGIDYVHSETGVVESQIWGDEFPVISGISDQELEAYGVIERLAVMAKLFGKTAELSRMIKEKLAPNSEEF